MNSEPSLPSPEHRGALPSPERRIAFLKVTAVGLGIGFTLGALSFLDSNPQPLYATAEYIVYMTLLGLTGMGLALRRMAVNKEKSRRINSLLPTPSVPYQSTDKSPEYQFTTIFYESPVEGFQADTHARDKVMAAARETLLRMDHTKYPPH